MAVTSGWFDIALSCAFFFAVIAWTLLKAMLIAGRIQSFLAAREARAARIDQGLNALPLDEPGHPDVEGYRYRRAKHSLRKP